MQFDITPRDGLVDSDLVIRVIEAPPRSRVTISVQAEDGDGRTWRSSAQFLAGEDGSIDLSKEAPIQGAYNTLDPMGLIMAMAPVGKEPASIFATADAADLRLEFSAGDREAEHPTTAEVVRRFKATSVARMAIDDGAIHGTLYVPAGTDPRPAVVIVPGVIPAPAAALPLGALLASHGFVAFVVDYFGVPGLPETLAAVPLEHFRAAVEWLRARPQVDPARVGGIGLERGAEGLMAAAAHIPEVRLSALIAIAPTCVAWQGVSTGKGTVPAWTIGDAPVPYIAIKGGGGQKLIRSLTKKEGGAISQLSAHTDAINDAEAFRRAALPVEHIHAPMLLLAGFDDQQWPSGEMAELLYRARRAAKCTDGDQKLTFQKVGRLIRFPHLPPNASRYLDRDGGGLMLGGTPEATLHADEVAWAKTLDFLGTHLGRPEPAPAFGQAGVGEVAAAPPPPIAAPAPSAPAPPATPAPAPAPPPGDASMPAVIPPPPRPPSALPPVIPPPPRPQAAAGAPPPSPPPTDAEPAPPAFPQDAPPPPPAGDFSPPPSDFSPPPSDEPEPEPEPDPDLPPSFS